MSLERRASDPFYVIPPGAHPQLLGTTLADTGLDQVATAPDGRLAIAAEIPAQACGPGDLAGQDSKDLRRAVLQPLAARRRRRTRAAAAIIDLPPLQGLLGAVALPPQLLLVTCRSRSSSGAPTRSAAT
jgi:hypothetical protein